MHPSWVVLYRCGVENISNYYPSWMRVGKRKKEKCVISVVGDQERIGRKRNGEPHQRGGGAGDRKCHPFLFSPFCRAQDRTGPTWRVGGGLSSCLFDQIKIKGPLLLLLLFFFFFFFFFFFPHFFVTRTARHGTEG